MMPARSAALESMGWCGLATHIVPCCSNSTPKQVRFELSIHILLAYLNTLALLGSFTSVSLRRLGAAGLTPILMESLLTQTEIRFIATWGGAQSQCLITRRDK